MRQARLPRTLLLALLALLTAAFTTAPAAAAPGESPIGHEAMHDLDEHGDLIHAEGDLHPIHADDDGEPSLFASDPWPYIWNLLMFAVLVAVLAKFVWPVILDGLQARETKIRSDLESAQTKSREADETLDRYKRQLADAQTESQTVIAAARDDAKRVAEDLKASTQREIEGMKERAQREIEAAKQQAVAEVYEQAAVLSTDIAGQILGREIRPEDHRDLVEQSVSRVGDVSRN